MGAAEGLRMLLSLLIDLVLPHLGVVLPHLGYRASPWLGEDALQEISDEVELVLTFGSTFVWRAQSLFCLIELPPPLFWVEL